MCVRLPAYTFLVISIWRSLPVPLHAKSCELGEEMEGIQDHNFSLVDGGAPLQMYS